MNRTSIPISTITVLNRQRLDLGDIKELADSISLHGLIQPIVINQDNRLIAGGRRLAAHQFLGRTHIDVVYKETMAEDVLHELELEENIKRKEMSWQERCLNIAKIHELKRKRSALEGESWGQRQTGELIGLAATRVNYSLKMAELLRKGIQSDGTINPDSQLWKCDSFSDAWKLVMRAEEEKLLSELARRHACSASSISPNLAPQSGLDSLDALLGDGYNAENGVANPAAISICQQKFDDSTVDISSLEVSEQELILALREKCKLIGYEELTEHEQRRLFQSNPTNSQDEDFFQAYRKERYTALQTRNTINLSSRVFNTNSIDFMLANPALVDHIITDPPYGIDMAMLDQQNVGMVEIDTVAAEHDVEENELMLTKFFPAAFECLKPSGFCITWCDVMQWDLMYSAAVRAGFKVQRWPLTWVKLHRCMNQAAQYNFTKSTEIAMVCRKGSATLVKPAGECHISAMHDDYKEQLGHPFVKPFDVWKFCLDHVSMEGQTILEPFAGRGSGVLSIARMNRQFIACELNQQHFNALLENIKSYYWKINPAFTFV